MTIGAQSDAASWDPSEASSIPALQYLQPVYDSIVRRQPNGSVVPMLAKSWSYNSDRTVLTLKIRTGVKFSDGTSVDASAIKLNLDDFRNGTGSSSKVSSISSVEAPNPTTVVIHLRAPDPDLLEVLGGYPAGFVASPKAIAAKTIGTSPDGSGPYTLDKSATVQGSTYTFVKRIGYWDQSLQKYDKIVIKPITDPTAMLNALVSGQLDAAPLTAKTAAPAKAAGMIEYEYPTNFSGLFIFDRSGKNVKALGSVQVRQAINYALDKQAIVTEVDDGLGAVTSQTFGPSTTAFVPSLDNAYPYNPAKAKQLLAAAGYPRGFTLTMPVTASTDQAVTAAISQDLKNVGITVKYVTVSPDNYSLGLDQGKWPVAWFENAQYQTWLAIETLVAPDAVLNPDHYTDARSASLIRSVQDNGDNAKAEEKASQALNTYITKQAWFAPMDRETTVFFSDKRTKVSPQARQVMPSIYDYTPAD